jgi:hypothetical protein
MRRRHFHIHASVTGFSDKSEISWEFTLYYLNLNEGLPAVGQ